jgi:hypothetical protein
VWATAGTDKIQFFMNGKYDTGLNYYYFASDPITLPLNTWTLIVVNRDPWTGGTPYVAGNNGGWIPYVNGNANFGVNNSIWNMYAPPTNVCNFGLGDQTALGISVISSGSSGSSILNLAKLNFHSRKLTVPEMAAMVSSMLYGPPS